MNSLMSETSFYVNSISLIVFLQKYEFAQISAISSEISLSNLYWNWFIYLYYLLMSSISDKFYKTNFNGNQFSYFWQQMGFIIIQFLKYRNNIIQVFYMICRNQ